MNRHAIMVARRGSPRIGLLLVAGFVAAAPGRVGAASAAPELWRRAVAVFEANRHLQPGRVRASFAIVDDKGKPKRTSEREMRYALDGQGRVQAELVRALDNGRDVTAKARSALRPERGDGDGRDARQGEGARASVSLGDVPFAAGKQEQVEVLASPETAALFGMTCRRFDFTMRLILAGSGRAKGKTVSLRGMAWIDEEGGRPVKLEFAPEPLPSKVKSLWTVFTYGPGAGGEWLLKEISGEGAGGFLFIKRRFRSRIELGDYFAVPSDSDR
jgi:hypothetical protein